MKVLHSWLAEYIVGLDDHPVGSDPVALGDVMSDIGLCCEEVELLGRGLDGIVVAQVLELAPHPGADRIQLVQVDAGDGEPLQICCGAFNMAVGDRVPLATLGTVMPDGMEIARRKLRGEWSNGMLCSARELGLGDDHGGIWILPGDPGVPLGTAIRDALGIEADALYDLDLTPNRPDALSVIGIARDVAAQLGLTFRLPGIELAPALADAASLASISISDPGLCGRFTARVLSDVPSGSSPEWMQRRLALCGMRPISAVVDVSNYVMLEYGQPNHTYDLAKVGGSHLGVRRARSGESIVTLDGQSRGLDSDDGVIVDGNDTPIGLAGVMGGASTEISDTTGDVLVELAWWDPASIGRTSKRHGLRSRPGPVREGVDPEIASAAADRIAQLLCDMGRPCTPVSCAQTATPPPAVSVRVRPSRVNALLGASIATDEMVSILTPLGFECTPDGDDLAVRIPSWRPDSTGEVDVVEEIARHYGYDRLGKTVPASPQAGALTARQADIRALHAYVSSQGAFEATPMPFLAPGDLERCGVRADGVVVANPLVNEESILRTSLLPGLLKAVGHNAAHRSVGVTLYEHGHCFAQALDGGLPQEWEEFAVVLAGRDAVAAVALARGIAESLGVTGRGGALEADRRAPPRSVGRGRRRWCAHRRGRRGRPRCCRGVWGVRASGLRPVSRMPSSDVDLAFVVADEIAVDEVEATIRATAGESLVSVALFDVYRGAGLGDDVRSLAYRLRLQARDRTLTDAEVGAIREQVIAAVASTHAATLRG
ncbi:MAG: phenylalanine--tRNA ligase subunit beta [Actinobacteria bacterium]|nr:phenylalanine--tRNA ligase subunit beta [Actinomycetota bacterium]